MPPATTTSQPSAARNRLLETASRIFYAEGIHSVGVDRIIAEAQVTRATFYRHFPGKEDLVRAYIENRDQRIRSAVAEAFTAGTEPRALLALVMSGIGEEICGRDFRGCPFVNAVAEYPDPDHPVHRAVRAHRDWFRQTIRNLVAAAGHPEVEQATATLLLLRDGAMVGGDLDDSAQVRGHFERAVHAVLAPSRGGDADGVRA